ncbi:MAG: N-carbamoyl-D-amino-acid hydrolase [Acetobacteraceae bacterium]|nr:N-carbamoyl-D-amino-acid hydrolase [Acetobacteraceae bacterium]
MSRILRVAGAQMAGIQKSDTRPHTLARLIALLEAAAADRASLVVFPELAFTTFFPRWLLPTTQELDTYFEREMPNPNTQPLFTRARELKIGLNIGYAELTPEGKRFNTSIITNPDGSLLGKYRKIHLPGSVEPRPGARFQQLEKRYFEYGDLGFPTFRAPHFANGVLGMLICNDRRWPEAWRVLALRGAELVVIGYNSAAYDPNGGDSETPASRTEHSQLAARANAYMNATWAITVAKAGDEDGSGLIGGSCIVDPNGHIVAVAKTLGDELITADIDLDACRQGREKMFNFAQHRRPQWYGPITSQIGAEPPK